MIISHLHRLVILHIPKTGGSTLTEYFRKLKNDQQLGDDELEITWGVRESDGLDLAHVSAQDVPERARGYQWIAVVRNPYDRLYSCYRYYLAYPDLHELYRICMPPDMTFDEFVREVHRSPERWSVHAQPMTRFCNREQVAQHRIHVMRTETLSQEFTSLLQMLGLPDAFENVNVACDDFDNSFKYAAKYTPETLRLVRDMYAEDFETFGY